MCTLQMLLQCGKVCSWLLASVCLRGEDMEEQFNSWNWEQQVKGGRSHHSRPESREKGRKWGPGMPFTCQPLAPPTKSQHFRKWYIQAGKKHSKYNWDWKPNKDCMQGFQFPEPGLLSSLGDTFGVMLLMLASLLPLVLERITFKSNPMHPRYQKDGSVLYGGLWPSGK